MADNLVFLGILAAFMVEVLLGLLILLHRPQKKKVCGELTELARKMSRYFLDGKPAEDILPPDPVGDGEWMVRFLTQIPRSETCSASELLRQIAAEAVIRGSYPTPLNPHEKCYQFGQSYYTYVSWMIGDVMRWVARHGALEVEKKMAETAK